MCRPQHGPRPVVLQQPTSLASWHNTVQPCSRRASQTAAADTAEPVLPENIDPNDPELQKQIDAILKELDPDFLLVRTACRCTISAVQLDSIS